MSKHKVIDISLRGKWKGGGAIGNEVGGDATGSAHYMYKIRFLTIYQKITLHSLNVSTPVNMDGGGDWGIEGGTWDIDGGGTWVIDGGGAWAAGGGFWTTSTGGGVICTAFKTKTS